eukprot:TRINITY_DN4323_c0_g1_i1.p1 TRINITY_DN4323_c0_g1~~TRINITY_DN4323_c0_g1_i1.p1  ORF type:complete len:461 (-),score=97.76 TRINITY_DN4323_c0_g1_i1:74-1456(-)
MGTPMEEIRVRKPHINTRQEHRDTSNINPYFESGIPHSYMQKMSPEASPPPYYHPYAIPPQPLYLPVRSPYSHAPIPMSKGTYPSSPPYYNDRSKMNPNDKNAVQESGHLANLTVCRGYAKTGQCPIPGACIYAHPPQSAPSKPEWVPPQTLGSPVYQTWHPPHYQLPNMYRPQFSDIPPMFAPLPTSYGSNTSSTAFMNNPSGYGQGFTIAGQTNVSDLEGENNIEPDNGDTEGNSVQALFAQLERGNVEQPANDNVESIVTSDLVGATDNTTKIKPDDKLTENGNANIHPKVNVNGKEHEDKRPISGNAENGEKVSTDTDHLPNKKNDSFVKHGGNAAHPGKNFKGNYPSPNGRFVRDGHNVPRNNYQRGRGRGLKSGTGPGRREDSFRHPGRENGDKGARDHPNVRRQPVGQKQEYLEREGHANSYSNGNQKSEGSFKRLGRRPQNNQDPQLQLERT